MAEDSYARALRGQNLNKRTTAKAAGYMELAGAFKDGECNVVEVDGGVSGDLGCSNLFKPVGGAKKFNCDNCMHYRSKEKD